MKRNFSLSACLLMALLLTGALACANSGGAQSDENPQAANADNQGDQGIREPAGDVSEEPMDENGEDADVADMTSEVLFDGSSRPDDWPGFLPLHPDMMVTEYTNTDESLHASGYADLPIPRLSNWVTNMFVNENTMVDWGPDPDKESIDRGDDQVFYLVRDGWTLVIELTEVNDNRCTFKYTMTPTD
jgi:hypothetical protein